MQEKIPCPCYKLLSNDSRESRSRAAHLFYDILQTRFWEQEGWNAVAITQSRRYSRRNSRARENDNEHSHCSNNDNNFDHDDDFDHDDNDDNNVIIINSSSSNDSDCFTELNLGICNENY
ncbi:hypothetical protein RCL_jg15623.t1 [Rhizophagus clarus]|uniref:Uncharacterized protein n=1 Tax=Rhizophagus clarus TaxID=94130 RepID=A0A8H3MC78_9GLOM|nr:hypothetical protein RCL_jg15623.t1 [Rhizophagus clarus]